MKYYIRRTSKSSNRGNMDMVDQQATQEKVPVQNQTEVSTSTRMKKANVSLNNHHQLLLDNANTPKIQRTSKISNQNNMDMLDQQATQEKVPVQHQTQESDCTFMRKACKSFNNHHQLLLDNANTPKIRRTSKISNGNNMDMVDQQVTQEKVPVQHQTQVSASACMDQQATQEKVPVQYQTQVSASTCMEKANVSLNNQQQLLLDNTDTPNTQVTASTGMRKANVFLNNQQDLLLYNANTQKTAKEYEWEVVMKSIELQLKNLDSQQQDFAQKLISDIIFYGKRGKLSDSTVILVESHHTPSLRPSQDFEPHELPNWNYSVPSHQSVWYSHHTPPSSISRGTQHSLPAVGTPPHHTHVKKPQISIEVVSSPVIKQEEIVISDNEHSD